MGIAGAGLIAGFLDGMEMAAVEKGNQNPISNGEIDRVQEGWQDSRYCDLTGLAGSWCVASNHFEAPLRFTLRSPKCNACDKGGLR